MNLSRIIVRRRRWLALGWALLAAALLPAAGRVGGVLETLAQVPGSESERVEQLLHGPLASAYARFVVLVVGGIPSPATAPGRRVLQHVVPAIDSTPGVTGTFSYLDSDDSLFVTKGKQGTFVIAGLAAGDQVPGIVVPALKAHAARLAEQFQTVYPGATARITGESALNIDLRHISSVDVRRAEHRALPVTSLLLLLVFGAVAAALLPVVCAAVAIAISLGLAALLASVWPLGILLQSVVTMLGLGLGIDYALLMVTRFREAMASGQRADDAAEEVTRHAGHTILLSAATVVIGFLALLLVPLNEIRAIAVGGLLVVVLSALLATTLLPGIMAWCGTRIDWGRVHRRDMTTATKARWEHLGRAVTAHPWRALVVGGVPLLLLASQSVRLHTGLPRGDWLPASMESAQALRDLRAMGHGGMLDQLRVVLELAPDSSVRRSAGWRALKRLDSSLAADPRIDRVHSVVGLARAAGMGRSALAFLPDSVTQGLVSREGRFALVDVVPRESLTPEDLVALVRELRRRGAADAGLAGSRVLVGGLPAFNADYRDAVVGRFGQVATLVVAGTLLALLIGTRAVLVPLKAVILNLLSVAAAFGAMTMVFQDGLGGHLFGVAEPLGAVFSTLPVVVFCMVFGLSMDYEVFLIARIIELKRGGAGNREAIVQGMIVTGPVITSAAAIMLAVFAAFALGDLLLVKMLGFALAVAVLLDATIVRMVISPALLQLAGRWNWWPGMRNAQPVARYPRTSPPAVTPRT